MAEAVLEHAFPARPTENGDDRVDDRRVSGIEQRVAGATAPLRRERQADLEDGGDRAKGPDSDGLEPARFEQRDHLLADAGSRGDIDLPPMQAAPDGSK